jgi:hypothetical protein
MSDTSSLGDSLLSAAALRRVDEVCARFEDVWRAGRRPRLETFLGQLCGLEREELLRELLRLERYYRESRGEALAGDDYEARFPEHTDLIRAVLAEERTVAAAAETSEVLFRADTPDPPAAPAWDWRHRNRLGSDRAGGGLARGEPGRGG